ncbi:MAG: hypothetical protein AB7G93_22555 [Bdellovibrionales bacterium]
MARFAVCRDKFQGKLSHSSIEDEIDQFAQYLRREAQRGFRYDTEILEFLSRIRSSAQSSPAPYNGSLSPVLPDAFLNELRQVFVTRNQDYVDADVPTETLIRRLAWARLSQEQRSALVAQLVDFAFPEEIFPQATIAAIRSDLYKSMENLSAMEKLDLYDTIRSSLILLLSREEFLTM